MTTPPQDEGQRLRSGFADLDAEPGHVSVVNETGLEDGMVLDAVKTYFVENASVGGMAQSKFGLYANNEGSLLARANFKLPTNVIEEIRLARDLAEKDDDVSAAIGAMMGIAYADELQHLHRDEQTMALFNEWSKQADLDSVFKEFYREYLIAGSFTSISLYTRTMLTAHVGKEQTEIKKQVSVPVVGVLPAEQIRVLEDDTFGTAPLYWLPCHERQRKFLSEFWDPNTSPARKSEMRRLNPVWAAAFISRIKAPYDDNLLFESIEGSGDWLYELNPRMVGRTTMPKGSWAYPRPPLTRDFALLEAKRLLNIMDYSLLQGGTNYIVVAKKGSDQKPAKPAEVTNLYNVIRSASRTGVIVGDHRLSLEIITPELKELLNAEKRALLGRKLANAMLRIPESSTTNPGTEGIKLDGEIMSRVITSDRNDIRRHVERLHQRTVDRNRTTFTKGAPKVWFPKIVLSGVDAFNALLFKLSDRGLIPNKWLVEAGGFDYDSAVEQRRREHAHGDDEVLVPGNVPFDQPSGPPGGLPGDQGRPPGASRSNGRPGGPPTANGNRPAPARGETVRAWYEEDANAVRRVGDLTFAVLEEYPGWEQGRLTRLERRALDDGAVRNEGPLTVVPVNPGYGCEDFYACRLAEGLSMLVGRRKTDGAVVAKALCFKAPQFDLTQAENLAIRWGFPIPQRES